MKNEGFFKVIDSFSIRKRKQFYLIGKMGKGRIEENWFVNIPFNTSYWMSLKINKIEEIEIASENEPHMLLILDCDKEEIDFYMMLNINLENLPITIG